MTTHAHKLVYEMLDLMPNSYHRASLKAMLTLFLQAQGLALPEHSEHKSASALSRFLNLYNWPTRALIRSLRREALQVLLGRSKVGRRPILRAIVDLTPLQKSGSFDGLASLIHVLNKNRGLQLVVLYLEFDGWRVPWGFRVWRGKGSASPAQLGLKLIRTLPKTLTSRYEVRVLADGGFCSGDFLEGVRKLGHHAVVGVRKDRRIEDGTSLQELEFWGGREVYLQGLDSMPVYVASFWLRRDGGTKEQRFVLCTKALRGEHIVRWGKRRWRIEGFFKTIKGRFGFDRFAQKGKLGVYRYLILSLAAYLLAHWGHLSQGRTGLPRWGEAAQTILEEVLAEMVIKGLMMEIKERSALLRSHGIEVRVDGCKI